MKLLAVLLAIPLFLDESAGQTMMAHDVGVLFNLGCWQDHKARAVPTIDCILGGNYRKRRNAITRCARYADEQGHSVFAVQHGGWCATSHHADHTYTKYGPSQKCWAGGKGGPWANQVYLIKKFYTDLGCWVDSMNRAVPSVDHMLGGDYRKRKWAIHQCGRLAASLGNNVFAVQHGGWCATSKTAEATYAMYGPSNHCSKNGKGGPWANQVYKIRSRCDSRYLLKNLGCWRDKRSRAIPTVEKMIGGNYRQRKNALQKCARLALELGNTVFAVQHGGWCATSKNAGNTYHKYGRYNRCQADGEGGPWANQVYEIVCLD